MQSNRSIDIVIPMVLIFLVVITVLLASDAYIVMNVMRGSSWWLRGVLLLPTALYCLVLVKLFVFGDTRQSMLNLLFWLTLCIVLPTLFFVVVSLIGKAAGLLWPSAAFWCNIAGTAIALAWLSVALYGIIAGWKKVTVEHVEISSERIPEAFDGYRIVQLSDFHIGTYGASPRTVDKIVETVNSLSPNLIVFTGDLVNSSSDEITQFKDVLSRLKAKDGILSVLGNHDYCLYREYHAPDTPAKELARVVATEGEIGWRLLRNESVQIRQDNDSIALVGVDNAGSRMFPDKSDLPQALAGLPASEFKILLSHDPSHWRREVLPHSDVDLMLAGHTHAMQFKIGNWSPSAWTYPEWGGIYREGSRMLYVSTGIGENVAFRFGAWPQIVILTLRSARQ